MVKQNKNGLIVNLGHSMKSGMEPKCMNTVIESVRIMKKKHLEND